MAFFLWLEGVWDVSLGGGGFYLKKNSYSLVSVSMSHLLVGLRGWGWMRMARWVIDMLCKALENERRIVVVGGSGNVYRIGF